MNKIILILVGVLTLPFGLLTSTPSRADTQLSQALLYDVYQPLHKAFAESAERLAADSVGLCERRPASSGYTMQAAFTKLLETFSTIELYRIGPLLEDNLQNRLFYWPDKRRVGEPQLKALLQSDAIETLDAEQLAGKSVTLQGFTALERLLFFVSLQPIEESPQCHLIPVVARNIANMATQLDTAWQSDSEFVRSLRQPYADSKHFRSSEEVLRSIFTQVKVGLDIVLNSKLAPLLSADQKAMAQAPFWESQRVVANIKGNLRGLKALLLESGMLDDTHFQDELQIEFDYLDHVIGKLKFMVRLVEPTGELTRESRVLLHQVAAVVARIRYVVSVEVAFEFGIKAGFNSEDGD